MPPTHSPPLVVMADMAGHTDSISNGSVENQEMSQVSKTRRRWTVRSRLYLCFLLVLSFMVLVTGAGIHEVNKIDAALAHAVDVAAAKQRYAVNMRGSVHDRAIAARDLALLPSTNDPREAGLQGEIRTLANNYALNWKQAVAMPASSPREQSVLNDIRNSETRAIQTLERLNAVRRTLSGSAADIALNEVGPAFVDWLAAINAYIDQQENNSRADIALARETATTFTLFIAAMTAAAIVMSLVIATLIARKLQSELGAEPHELIVFAREIGQGNLKARPFAADRPVPPGSVIDQLLSMAGHLTGIVTSVRNTAQTISQAGARLDQTTADLAHRTETQTAAVTQTATAVEQLSHIVHQNADTAREAAGRATQAADTTTQMRSAMTQVRETMHKIDGGAKQIGHITSLIDEIAFQTNILALNASVEAARAGINGKGFAVVATEVRNLAQRSSEAASHISKLIEENLGLVVDGTQLVETADRYTSASMESVQEVSGLIQGISQGSMEQASGVEQIRDAVAQINEITQGNGRVVRDSTAMASALRYESTQLEAGMQAFKV